jgi:hypothetical protein
MHGPDHMSKAPTRSNLSGSFSNMSAYEGEKYLDKDMIDLKPISQVYGSLGH